MQCEVFGAAGVLFPAPHVGQVADRAGVQVVDIVLPAEGVVEDWAVHASRVRRGAKAVKSLDPSEALFRAATR